MAHLINADRIVVKENRQRREFSETEHQDLITSLGGPAGLLHPIVLRQEGDQKVLVAGERRLRAIKEMGELGIDLRYGGLCMLAGIVPYNDLGELDPLDAMEAELEENIRRKDLTWQERAQATSKLFDLRVLQAAAAGQPTPSMREVSEEVGRGGFGAGTTIVKEMQIARHLSDPEVAAASSVKEAHKILVRKEETKKNERLAEQVGRTFTSSNHACIRADSREWLSFSGAGIFDVICTDPPYGMGADEFGDSGNEGTREHAYVDSAEALLKILKWFPGEAFRVTKAAAHVYVFCDFDHFSAWKGALQSAGWRVFRTPLIWAKPNGFRAPWPEHGPRRSYETILFAIKGDKKITKLAPDVITCPLDESLGHSAQKPVRLIEDLLSRSCLAGDNVLDPFMGTGTIFAAAQGLKVTATGIEKEAAAFGIAVKRLEGLK